MSEQQNVVVNTKQNLVFFGNKDLCYNYKTGQWSRVPAFSGQGYYSIISTDGIIGQVITSGASVDLQTSTSGAAVTALVTTQEADPNQFGRAVSKGVRPLLSGGTAKVRVGVRDSVNETARINYLRNSEDPSQWVAINNNIDFTLNAATAPNGTQTATLLTATATNPSLAQNAIDAADATNGNIFSIHAKKGNKAESMNRFLIRNGSTGVNLLRIDFNYDTGVATIDSVGSKGANTDYRIEELDDDWWYIELFAGPENFNENEIVWGYATSTGLASADAIGDYVYIWGGAIMRADARRANTYVKTESVTVTEDVHWSRFKGVNDRTGFADIRWDGRYHRVEMTIVDAITAGLGADLDFNPQGLR